MSDDLEPVFPIALSLFSDRLEPAFPIVLNLSFPIILSLSKEGRKEGLAVTSTGPVLSLPKHRPERA
jgi:hypothetical protein